MARDGAAVKTFLFFLLVPGTVVVWVPHRLLLGAERFQLGSLRFTGVAPIGLGLAILVWCFWDFVYAGRGTPLPLDPPRFLVARGLYRFVRNPMYWGVELILLGEGLLFESARLWVYALGAGVFFHLFVVLYEERALRKKFGDQYVEYCRSVPRWFPRLQRHKPVA